ncbi:unnamed protein product [Mycena citricolor]|uniref:ABC transporter domain-containing protein n=1 Tax=Mycena citricolor TaxID=2018698 RepID=A0AAD2HG86_9AGAR|nr:unnamed protein product [Mycena citricolor]
MAPRSKATPNTSRAIIVTSQQSRFHAETLDTSREIDLKGVTIAIGERELISQSHLRLKDGVRYGLVGRNGSGKTTLLTAIADKLIPGLNPRMRILLLSQVEDSARATDASAESGAPDVLQHVIKGDKERQAVVEEHDALTKAVESTSLQETQRIVYTLRLEKRRRELIEARKVASRRSGARGKDARAEEIKAEENLKKAEELLETTEIEPDIMGQALEMLQDVQVTLDLLETSSTEARAASILHGLGFSQEMIDGPYTSLSGGWRSRCSLATSLLVHSDILLLDEPSNFLDLEAIIWLEGFLNAQPRTLVLISHDQDFLNNVVEETIVLRTQKLEYFEGTPAVFEVEERKKRKHLSAAQETLDKKREQIEKTIQQGISSAKKTGDDNRARMAKSRQKKLDERWGAETSAKGTRFKLNRDMAGFHLTNRSEIEQLATEPRVRIHIENPEKLRTVGDLIHFDAVEFRFPKAKKAFLENITFTVSQGGRCAFVGANGQGKSTIAKLIMGTLKPTKGTVTRHPLLKIGYFSQHSVEELSAPSDGVVTALSYFLDHFEAKGEKVTEQEARKCLGSFGLQGKIASDAPLTQLSGGQKVRLALALIVFHPPPLLLLDEVTTHVDFATIQSLAQALKTFTGAIIMITHDRWFSRVVVERVSLRQATGVEDDDDASDSESSDDGDGDGKGISPGKTYRVGGGKIKEMDKGMEQYVAFVERKLARLQRERDAKT